MIIVDFLCMIFWVKLNSNNNSNTTCDKQFVYNSVTTIPNSVLALLQRIYLLFLIDSVYTFIRIKKTQLIFDF